MPPRLSHGFVFVRELAPMVRFYQRAFGFQPQPSSDDGFVRMAGPGGVGVALHRMPEAHRGPPPPQPPPWRDDTAYKLCFATDDLDALRAAIMAHGGQAKDPWTWEGRRYCECVDPEGNVVQIFEPTPAAP